MIKNMFVFVSKSKEYKNLKNLLGTQIRKRKMFKLKFIRE